MSSTCVVQTHGLEHISGIGQASSSLGLVATLVMAITLETLLEPTDEATTLLLLIANAFSVYTVTFSVLEFYYAQIMLSAEKRALEPEHELVDFEKPKSSWWKYGHQSRETFVQKTRDANAQDTDTSMVAYKDTDGDRTVFRRSSTGKLDLYV